MNWIEINNRIEVCLKSSDPLSCLLRLFEETGDGMVAFRIGEIYQKRGEIDKALRYYEIAYDRFPLPKYKNMAKQKIESLKRGLMDWTEVNERIRNCLSSSSPIKCLKKLYDETKDGMVAFNLGELFETRGDLNEALKYYTIAHEKFPLKEWKERAYKRIESVKAKLAEEEKQTKVLFIVSCTRSKIWEKDESKKYVPAKYAYIGKTMRIWLTLEESKKYPWIIFSSKYGFIDPDHPIKNYDIHFVNDRDKAVSDITLLRQIEHYEFEYNGRSFKIKDFDVIYFVGSREYYDELKKIFDRVGLKFEMYPRWIPLENKKSVIDKVLNLINPALKFLILLNNPQKITSADIPDEEGVYAIIHDGEVIYIGSSNNLRRRILDNHLRGSKDKSVLRAKLIDKLGSEKAVTEFLSKCEVAFMTTKDISCSRKALEHYLIAMLEPKYNS